VAPGLEALYKAYRQHVAFFLVYVREAHPVREGTESDGSPRSPREIAQPKTFPERAQAAVDCLRGLNLSLPVLVDRMDDAVRKAYGGWPAGTAVVDTDGKIRFHSRGPQGAKPEEARKALDTILGELKAAGRLPAPETDGEVPGEGGGAAGDGTPSTPGP